MTQGGSVTQGGRRDAARRYHRILGAARDVLGESGAEASMEEIATRGRVGVGTVYRRFASKDALIDELVRLATQEMTAAAERALARADGNGLEKFLCAIGRQEPTTRCANLLLERPVDPRATQRLRDAAGELTARAAEADGSPGRHPSRHGSPGRHPSRHGSPGRHPGRHHGAGPGHGRPGQDAGEVQNWPRFLDIHLAGLRAATSLS